MVATSKLVDFTNVKEGGNFNKNRIPAGDYLATITKVEDAPAKGDGGFQYLFSIKIVKRPGTVLPYYCKLQENQLWKLRNIFIAAGKSIPKKKLKVDVNSLVGKQIGVTIADTEYEGKDQSEIDGLFPAAELDDAPDDEPIEDDDEGEEEEEGLDDLDAGEVEDEADEEPEAEDEADDEEEEEADPLLALDRTALKAELKRLDPTFQAKKSQTDDDLRELLRGAATPAEEEDDEEEEEAPAPVAKKAAPKKAAPKKKVAEVTDDELEELDIDDL